MSEQVYYKDIDDIPLYNWIKCHDGELRYVRKDVNKGTDKEDEEAFTSIYDAYLKVFGFGVEADKLIALKQELVQLNCRFIAEDDRFILNEIDVVNNDIKILEDSWKGGGSITTAIVHLSKWVGSIIDEKTMSVKTFYTMLGEYKKEMDLIKKNNG